MEVDKEISEAMAKAKHLAEKEFGTEGAANPAIVSSLFQGIASLEQAAAMKVLGDMICAAAEHARNG